MDMNDGDVAACKMKGNTVSKLLASSFKNKQYCNRGRYEFCTNFKSLFSPIYVCWRSRPVASVAMASETFVGPQSMTVMYASSKQFLFCRIIPQF